ncbi:MAG: zf-HC2 domain-containing protein [Chloroflexi bacterium]|nr:zf-HC2 domain-containing protein [Chloroflexota bacterium]
MNCRKVIPLLLSYLDGEVGSAERQAIQEHLAVCPSCRAETEALATTGTELRQALGTMAEDVRPGSRAWANIRERLLSEEPGSTADQAPAGPGARSRLRRLICGQPAWAKALASTAALAMILWLAATVLGLPGNHVEALAERIAVEDPGTQVLLAESGFVAGHGLNIVVTRSGQSDICFVQFVDASANVLVSTVTVDVNQQTVTEIGVGEHRVEYVSQSATFVRISTDEALDAARTDGRVSDILNEGATVGAISFLTSPGQEIVALELSMPGKVWLVKMDWLQKTVIDVFER